MTRIIVLALVSFPLQVLASPSDFLSSAPHLSEGQTGTCASLECPAWKKQIDDASNVTCATESCGASDEGKCCVFFFVGLPWWAYIAACAGALCIIVCLP